MPPKNYKNKNKTTNILIPDIDKLTNLAFYLEGIREGKGDVLPFGTNDLDNLWTTIKFLQNLK